jgi:hypothetical protein
MVDSVRSALVSLWAHPTSTEERAFLCCGAFVAPCTVLTVRHIFEKHKNVWLRPLAAGPTSMAMQPPAELHPTLDAALVRIESMPPHATWMTCDSTPQFDTVPNSYKMWGYFEGREHAPLDVSVQAFDALANPARYTLAPKHPAGYSGAGIVRAGRLWAIATEHYVDPNINLGCAIGVHQIWQDWLQPRLAVTAATSPQPSSARLADSEALRTSIANDLVVALTRVFEHPAVRGFTSIDIEGNGVPRSILPILSGARSPTHRRDTGARLVASVFHLARDLTNDIDAQLISLPAGGKRYLRQRLTEAMGRAARLCLNPARLQAADVLDQTLLVSARSERQAMLVARTSPEKSWSIQTGSGLPRVVDRHVLSPTIEFGEGDDARRELARLLYAREHPTNYVPDKLSEPELSELRTWLFSEKTEGRTRCLVMRSSGTAVFGESVRAWLAAMGVGLIALTDDQSAELFWIEEEELFGVILAFLQRFEQNAVWKDT